MGTTPCQSIWVIDRKRLETYLGGVKPYIQKELKMHDIPNVEVARRKTKSVEAKFDNFQSNKGKSYSQRNIETTPETNTNKYILEGTIGRTPKIKG